MKVVTNQFPSKHTADWWVISQQYAISDESPLMAIRRCLFCPTFLSPTNGGRVPPKYNSIGKIGNFDPEDFLLKSIASLTEAIENLECQYLFAIFGGFSGSNFGPPYSLSWLLWQGSVPACCQIASQWFSKVTIITHSGGDFFLLPEVSVVVFSFDKRCVYTGSRFMGGGEMDKDFLLPQWWISQYNLDTSNFTPKKLSKFISKLSKWLAP